MTGAAPPQNRSLIVIIGVGNAHRGDDAVGLIIARHLREIIGNEALVHELTGDGSTLLDLWIGAAAVILVDAMRSGAAPGTVHRIDASTNPIPTTHCYSSTHVFSTTDAIELGRTLQQLPPQVIIYGVEGKDFAPGAELSPEVRKVISEVTEQVWGEVKRSLDRS